MINIYLLSGGTPPRDCNLKFYALQSVIASQCCATEPAECECNNPKVPDLTPSLDAFANNAFPISVSTSSADKEGNLSRHLCSKKLMQKATHLETTAFRSFLIETADSCTQQKNQGCQLYQNGRP